MPHVITTLIGQALFDLRHGHLYRWVAYGVIAIAVITGLPAWNVGM